MPKRIKESESIRIYVMADKSGDRMWRIEPPVSLKEKFSKKYPKGGLTSKPSKLLRMIERISNWKLKTKEEVNEKNEA